MKRTKSDILRDLDMLLHEFDWHIHTHAKKLFNEVRTELMGISAPPTPPIPPKAQFSPDSLWGVPKTVEAPPLKHISGGWSYKEIALPQPLSKDDLLRGGWFLSSATYNDKKAFKELGLFSTTTSFNYFTVLGSSPNSVDHYYHKSQIPSIEYLKEIRRDGGRFYFIEPRKKWLGLF